MEKNLKLKVLMRRLRIACLPVLDLQRFEPFEDCISYFTMQVLGLFPNLVKLPRK